MKGHKTSGDWSDVTSYGRNEIVFEGRHKEYGAYAVRQRYTNALLLALLISVSTGIICAGVPFVINLIDRNNVIPLPEKGVVADPTIYVTPYNTPKPKVKEQPKPKTPEPPKNNQTQNTTPIVVDKKDKPDSVPSNKDKDQTTPGTTTVNTGTKDEGLNHPKPDPGTGKDQGASTEVYRIVQNMPKFNGDLYKYVGDHLNYPTLESENRIEGTAFVSFVVETDGTVSNVKIERGIAGGPGLDEEALRVIKSLPAWTPGSQNGHPVRVQYTMPIKFQLR